MRVLIVLLALLVCVGVTWAQTVAPIWVTGAVITNPSANQVLVQKSGLSQGNWHVAAYVYSDVGVATILRHSRNGTVVESFVIPPSAKFIMVQAPAPLFMLATDTVDVISRGTVTAEVQVVLFFQQ